MAIGSCLLDRSYWVWTVRIGFCLLDRAFWIPPRGLCLPLPSWFFLTLPQPASVEITVSNDTVSLAHSHPTSHNMRILPDGRIVPRKKISLSWNPKQNLGNIWDCLASPGITWNWIICLGSSWTYLELYVLVWAHLRFSGFVWDHLGSSGIVSGIAWRKNLKETCEDLYPGALRGGLWDELPGISLLDSLWALRGSIFMKLQHCSILQKCHQNCNITMCSWG